jgi:hypothetical protein
MADVITLQDFITQTLLQIEHGVHNARRRQITDALFIAPIVRKIETVAGDDGETEEVVSVSPALEKVDFDLAVTVENEKKSGDKAKAGGGFKIGIFSADGGVSGESAQESRNSTVQKIRFSIPIMIRQESQQEAKVETTTRKKAPKSNDPMCSSWQP